MGKRLIDRLRGYSAGKTIPMHMPGHKRREAEYDYLCGLGAAYDLTEIAGFDNLHDPDGILREGMERLARVFGSRRAFFLVNGCTGGILAAVHTVLRSGDRVIVARNCHRSVYNALELCAARPRFVLPEYDEAFGISGSVSPDAIEAALEEEPDAKLVIITSPTYEGVVSNIAAICRIAHRRGVPVLVDEAHGAHLGFLDASVPGALHCGADIVIQGLHKTLPTLTQTAAAHVNGKLVPAESFARRLAMFETSSPSYLLMAALDGCAAYLEERGREAFAAWSSALDAFNKEIGSLQKLRILGYGRAAAGSHPAVYRFDRSKIVIASADAGMTGEALMRRLREEYDIELEMSAPGYAVAMTGLGTTAGQLEQLAAALLEIDAACSSNQAPALPEMTLRALPEAILPVARALEAPTEEIPAAEAEGRISAGYWWAYPPGIPLILPGETFSPKAARLLREAPKNGVVLRSDRGGTAGTVKVLKKLDFFPDPFHN